MAQKLSFSVLALLSAAMLAHAAPQQIDGQNLHEKAPFDLHPSGTSAKTSSTKILYHYGPVMQSPSVYIIYYGNFPSTAQPVINNFVTDLKNFSNADPYAVNTTYFDNHGPVLGSFAFVSPLGAPKPGGWDQGGSVYWDNYSLGAQLTQGDILKIIAGALTMQSPDTNGIYVVITSPDVKVNGFCSKYCAYHSNASVHGVPIRYAFVPDPAQKCSGCNGGIAIYGDTATPNLDMGADTVTDDLMHELSETVTDPDGNAWYTANGSENGDLCNYVYATPESPIQTGSKIVNGVTYNYHKNFTLNGHDYLVQFIWKNIGAGYCAAH